MSVRKKNSADATVYMTGIPLDMTWMDIKSYLDAIGTVVHVKLIHEGKHSTAAAFVSMRSDEDANYVIDEYNGAYWDRNVALKCSLVRRPSVVQAPEPSSMAQLSEQPPIDLKEGDEKVYTLNGKKWEYGVKRKVSFFKEREGKYVTLVHIDDPILESLLDRIKDETVLTLDLEWWAYQKPQVINVFQIGCLEGAIVVHSPRGGGNQVMEKFLNATSGRRFVAKGCGCDRKMLQQCFPGVHVDMEDVERTKLAPNGMSANFDQMVATFAGETTIPFKDKAVTMSKWNRPLSECQVMYAAFDVVALYDCIPNFPETTKLQKSPVEIKEPKRGREGSSTNWSEMGIVDGDVIETKLQNVPWCYGVRRAGRLFVGNGFLDVTLVRDDDPNLAGILADLGQEQVLTLHLGLSTNEQVRVFQIGYSGGALLVHCPDGVVGENMKNFLDSSTGRRFKTRRCALGIEKLQESVPGITFDIEDVGVTELAPRGCSQTFVKMVKQFTDRLMIGASERKVIDTMVWDNCPTEKQVVLGASNVIGLYWCLPNFGSAGK